MPQLDAELAERIAQAVEELGFFIFDSGLEDAENVFRILREARVEHVVTVTRIDARRGLYLIEPLDRGCRRICVYEKGCGDDKACLEECARHCIMELRQKISEAIRRVARRSRPS